MEQVASTYPQLLGEKQTAHVLAVSVAALRRWRRERRGPAFVKLERCIRYSVGALEHFLNENSVGTKKAVDSRLTAQAEVRNGHSTPKS